MTGKTQVRPRIPVLVSGEDLVTVSLIFVSHFIWNGFPVWVGGEMITFKLENPLSSWDQETNRVLLPSGS